MTPSRPFCWYLFVCLRERRNHGGLREPWNRRGADLEFPVEKPGDCGLADYAKDLYPGEP